MGLLPNITEHNDGEPRHERRDPRRLRYAPGLLGSVFAVILIASGFIAFPFGRAKVNMPLAQASSNPGAHPAARTEIPPTPTETRTLPAPKSTETDSPTTASLDQPEISGSPINQGMIILSLSEGSYSHLFAFQPSNLPLTRLTSGPWDDITPSTSVAGSQVAFASNRDGQWDLYVLDIDDGDTTRMTQTAEYDAAPSLSPDGQYVVYESYVEGNLEIIIRDVKGALAPINLSKHPAADFRPAWSPRGRQVAFVSTRSGETEIWIADLDKGDEERFTNLSQSPRSMETNPAWSPDGSALSWASTQDGIRSIWIQREDGERHYAGSGDRPVWSPDGSTLLSTLKTPNQTLLSGYTAQDSLLVLPPIILPGDVQGLAWLRAAPSAVLPEGLEQTARVSPTPLWFPELTPEPDIPGNRHHLVPLVDVAAPYPQLHDMVDDSFLALRERVAEEAGWDLLATLENAYVPLTAPLAPGLGNDWLYTGRAFTITPLPINAGWMVVVPEKFGFETYWRVYLKARFQDGSQGKPLPAYPWDLNARYSGDQVSYEQGGIPHENMPVGYWIDFTALASAYGWERLPALPNWQSLFQATRFNEFVHSGRQDWRSAMLELYPAEALVTPTIVPPPTQTATPTPRWYRTPTPTLTATSIPTLTPLSPAQTSPITPSP